MKIRLKYQKIVNNTTKKRITYNFCESNYTLTVNDCKYVNFCSFECLFFLKHAVCKHLVLYSNFHNLNTKP